MLILGLFLGLQHRSSGDWLHETGHVLNGKSTIARYNEARRLLSIGSIRAVFDYMELKSSRGGQLLLPFLTFRSPYSNQSMSQCGLHHVVSCRAISHGLETADKGSQFLQNKLLSTALESL